MSTWQERCTKTLELANQDDVSIREGLGHIYWWLRFEWSVWQRNKHANNAAYYARKLNTNLDVYEFRKEMSNL